MKKTIAIIGAIALMSFAAEKYVNVKFTEAQINFHWQNMETIKRTIDQSSLPHNQAQFIIASIDSLQKDIQKSAKLDSTIKK